MPFPSCDEFNANLYRFISVDSLNIMTRKNCGPPRIVDIPEQGENGSNDRSTARVRIVVRTFCTGALLVLLRWRSRCRSLWSKSRRPRARISEMKNYNDLTREPWTFARYTRALEPLECEVEDERCGVTICEAKGSAFLGYTLLSTKSPRSNWWWTCIGSDFGSLPDQDCGRLVCEKAFESRVSNDSFSIEYILLDHRSHRQDYDSKILIAGNFTFENMTEWFMPA